MDAVDNVSGETSFPWKNVHFVGKVTNFGKKIVPFGVKVMNFGENCILYKYWHIMSAPEVG